MAVASTGRSPSGQPFSSPLSRALARHHGIALSELRGSGPQGRIVKADIAAALQEGGPSHAGGPGGADPATDLAHESHPHSLGRKLIARRVSESKQQAPHFYVRLDCDVGRIVQSRAAWPDGAGARPSVNAFVVHAAARALREVPAVNASWTAAAIRRFHAVNIAVAVALEEGLVTPVVHDADRKSVPQIAQEIRALAQQARAGTLAPGAGRGGTFSVSNLGAWGVREFTAVINPPQAAILAVGAAEQRAVVRNGALAVVTMVTVVLSADHRVIDGAVAATWLAAFRRHLEDPQETSS
jgi:pyruvate dehydrogenase E2 component (dihydrolipoamide acetyltransferase)